jgi:hypothetical protein
LPTHKIKANLKKEGFASEIDSRAQNQNPSPPVTNTQNGKSLVKKALVIVYRSQYFGG